jgi:hypothetical protein
VCGITHDVESGSDFEGFVKLENTSTQQEPEQGVGEMSLKMAQVHVSTENEKPEIYIAQCFTSMAKLYRCLYQRPV